jgi:hypothetical protein
MEHLRESMNHRRQTSRLGLELNLGYLKHDAGFLTTVPQGSMVMMKDIV